MEAIRRIQPATTAVSIRVLRTTAAPTLAAGISAAMTSAVAMGRRFLMARSARVFDGNTFAAIRYQGRLFQSQSRKKTSNLIAF